MPEDIWELPVRRDARDDGEVVGAVLFEGQDIIAFVSEYDFRDTDFDGNISFFERSAGFVGFHRSYFERGAYS